MVGSERAVRRVSQWKGELWPINASLNSKKNFFFYLTMSPQSSSHTEKEDDKKSFLNDQGNLLAPWRGSKQSKQSIRGRKVILFPRPVDIGLFSPRASKVLSSLLGKVAENSNSRQAMMQVPSTRKGLSSISFSIKIKILVSAFFFLLPLLHK